MAYLVENLQTSAKLRSFVPVSQSTFSDEDLITIANEEMHLKLVSDLLNLREDFFNTTKRVTLEGGRGRYTIPPRAIGNSFKLLWRVDSGGAKQKLDRIDVERISEFPESGDPVRFYIEGDEVVLVPKPATSGESIEFVYPARPNQLIATTSCAKITVVSSALGTTTLTVDTDLTASLSVGDKIDFLSAASPYLLWADNVEITAISSTQIQVLTADIDNEVGSVEPQVGDYVCPTGYANIPMLPNEFHAVLAQMTAVRLLAALGDLPKLQAAKADLAEVRDEALKLVKNRVENSPDFVIHKNSLLSAFT